MAFLIVSSTSSILCSTLSPVSFGKSCTLLSRLCRACGGGGRETGQTEWETETETEIE